MNQPFDPKADAPLAAVFRQHLWANLRMLDACEALDAQQLATTVEGTFGPIDRTLVHILRSEQGYLIDLTDQEPDSPLRPVSELKYEDGFDIDRLRAHARQSGEAFITIAAGLKPGDVSNLDNPEERMRWPVPTALILAQALNHATEHRAHIMTIMTHLGVEPPDVTGWGYIEEVVAGVPLE
jgi:uncharacterized damage-inducible protein DinB